MAKYRLKFWLYNCFRTFTVQNDVSFDQKQKGETAYDMSHTVRDIEYVTYSSL